MVQSQLLRLDINAVLLLQEHGKQYDEVLQDLFRP